MNKRNTDEEKRKRDLFEFKVSRDVEQKKVRKDLEKAYDSEKSKSVISKRCSRIYDEELRYVEKELLLHLKEEEVPAELHLTRWLRCVMSREFDVESTLVIWDYIFAGVVDSQNAERGRASAVSEYDEFDLRAP